MTTENAARLVAAGILTMLFSLLAAPSTSAYDRTNAVTLANNMIERCFREGGEPDGISSENTVLVYCKMPEGQPAGDLCEFWPGPPTCSIGPNLGDDRGEIPTDGALTGGSTSPPPGTTITSEQTHGHGNLTARSAKQDDENQRDHKSRKQRGKERRNGRR